MDNTSYSPVPSPSPRYPVGRQELCFGILTAVLAVGLWNSILYGGLNLGFAFFSLLLLGCNWAFLRAKGYRFGRYGTALLVYSAVITAGFARSSDGAVKAVMLLFSLFAANLSFCLAAKQNRRGSGGFSSLLDGPRTLFVLGFGGMGAAVRGLDDARKNAGSAGKKGSALLLGIAITVPVLAVMLPLLMRSDAAFEGLMDLLPETDWTEAFYSLLYGLLAGWVLFARGLALHHRPRSAPAGGVRRHLSPITVNTLLGAVGALYLVYLFSQLAYFCGGLSGILPEGYTLAEYARRGFFEMAWLSGINLCLILGCSGLVEKKGRTPAPTLALCLFLGAVTLFLIGTASAKMLLYIRSYGLTRLRVLTQAAMLWLAVTTVLVCAHLLKPRFPYMKAVILAALTVGSLLLWLDVDSCVARYNVRAYQEGRLETVDMRHLSGLGDGALPYVAELTQDADPQIAQSARAILNTRESTITGLRDWNYSSSAAADVLPDE